MAQTFFGPTKGLKITFLEEAFVLNYHLNISYSDARAMPITYRRWFIERLTEEFERKSENAKKNQRGTIVKDIPMGDIAESMQSMSDNISGIADGLQSNQSSRSFKGFK